MVSIVKEWRPSTVDCRRDFGVHHNQKLVDFKPSYQIVKITSATLMEGRMRYMNYKFSRRTMDLILASWGIDKEISGVPIPAKSAKLGKMLLPIPRALASADAKVGPRFRIVRMNFGQNVTVRRLAGSIDPAYFDDDDDLTSRRRQKSLYRVLVRRTAWNAFLLIMFKIYCH